MSAWVFLFFVQACTPAKSEEEQLTELVTAVPWMLEVMQLCQGYDGSSQDAKKNDISSVGLNLIRGSTVSGVRGTVARVLPVGEQNPPAEYSLAVVVGDKVEFASQRQKRPIAEASPVFAEVAKLSKGDCVVFSANELDPIADHQRGKICDYRYYARFTELAPCP